MAIQHIKCQASETWEQNFEFHLILIDSNLNSYMQLVVTRLDNTILEPGIKYQSYVIREQTQIKKEGCQGNKKI